MNSNERDLVRRSPRRIPIQSIAQEHSYAIWRISKNRETGQNLRNYEKDNPRKTRTVEQSSHEFNWQIPEAKSRTDSGISCGLLESSDTRRVLVLTAERLLDHSI
jgi:hypothetical protein